MAALASLPSTSLKGTVQPAAAYCAGRITSRIITSREVSLAVITVFRYCAWASEVLPPVSMATFTFGVLASYMSKALRHTSGRCWLETNTRRFVWAMAAEPERVKAVPASSSFMVLLRDIISSVEVGRWQYGAATLLLGKPISGSPAPSPHR